ncbi:MAG: S8 family serine peptidase [Candidatus Uhrbacteria bacterium]
MTPNDPDLDEQWYLDQISAYGAWDQTTGSNTVIVAILDSGLDLDHPDIKNNLWTNPGEIAGDGIDNDGNGYIDDIHGWDFIDNDGQPEPNFFQPYTNDAVIHGTLVAGIIGATADNNLGISGINWNVKLMPIRLLDGLGSGSSSDASEAVNYAVANGARVINSSFSGSLNDPLYRLAIRDAYYAGVAVIAAVGNNDDGNGAGNLGRYPIYPACYERVDGQDWVIGVGATDKNDNKADFSNYGDCVDISAPGVDVYGTLYQYLVDAELIDLYGGYWDGTSVAAPQVTGATALLLSIYPTLNVGQLQTVMQLSVDPVALGTVYQGQLGAGRLNIDQAIRLAANFALAEPEHNSSRSLVVSAHSDYQPEVRRFNLYTEQLGLIQAYDSGFTGGVRLAMGDVDGDGVEEIVTGAGPGGGPQVRVFELDGTLLSTFFAFEESNHAGIYVATGDVNGDGLDEIIVSSDRDSQGRVKAFDFGGNRLRTYWITEYSNQSIRVAVGDVDQDGIDEIITGLGPGGQPEVKVINWNGTVSNTFEAYATTYDKGIYVGVGDVDGDGIDEIVTGTDDGGGPHVRSFDQAGNVELSFFAYAENFRGGVHIGVGDMDGDGVDEIITAAGPGGGPHLRVFTGEDVIAQWYAFEEGFSGGINIALW